jgi:membrane associated rhomboid family serine protease
MLLPIRTNVYLRRTPYANYALIVINVLIFFLTYSPGVDPFTGKVIRILRPWAEPFMLTPTQPHLWQFVTYAFLHGSYIHIIGNMYFLYLFGNNVNNKIGQVGYLAFYFAGAILSGIGNTIANPSSISSTLGASGAIAAVTGAYLVLFPQTLITVLYWFFFIGTIEIPALYFIAFKMVLWDNVFEPNLAPGPVAYSAHLSGYAFGIGATLLLLATGLLSGSNFDLWAMIKQWNRRRQYRDTVSGGFDPFSARPGRKTIKVTEVQKPDEGRPWTAVNINAEKITELRETIANRLAQRNLSTAADAYLELMSLDKDQVLPRQQLLDIANQLASDNKPVEAARAYEQFLTHYGSYDYAEQVELMLGLLYSRYLHQPKKAIKHLQTAVEKLSDPGQLKMCKDELAHLV